MSRIPFAVAAVAVLSTLGGSARGDGGPAAGGLETRLYDVGALTTSRTGFLRERGPYPAGPDQVNDESQPLYPVEDHYRTPRPDGREEAVMPEPFIGLDDLIEDVKQASPPGTWEQEGSHVALLQSTSHHLWITGSAATHKVVAERLAALEREALSVAVVDLVAVGGDVPGGPERFAAALASGGVRVLATARASGWLGRKMVATSGSMAAFLQDFDVEVAPKSETLDPIVGIQKSGLSFQASAVRSGEQVLLHVDAWHAQAGERRVGKTAGGDGIELPSVEGSTFRATLRVAPGAWTLASGSGDVKFAVRVAVEPYDAKPAPGAALSRPAPSPVGAIDAGMVSVADLEAKAENRRGETIYLAPSNYTPPEPLELFEPMPLLGADALLEIVKSLDPAAWEAEGVSLEMRSGRLLLRHATTRREAAARLVAELRARLVRTVRLKATVVSLPASAWAAMLAGGDLSAALAGDAKGLLATEGASVTSRTTLRLIPGQRGAAVEGTSRAYVGDYDVEIADTSKIGNPVVFHVLDGLSLDLWPQATAGGGAVAVETRLDRSVWRGAREVPTLHGALDFPDVGILRLRGHRMVPLGATTLLAAGSEADVATLVLLAASAD